MAVGLIDRAWATRSRSFSAAPADAKVMLEEACRELVEAVSLCRRIGAQRELGRRDLYRTAGVRDGVADCAQRLARLSSTARPA